MDDNTFNIISLEKNLQQVSLKYNDCIANAINGFLTSDKEFNDLSKPCNELKLQVDQMLIKHKEITNLRLKRDSLGL